ncbi:MAG: acyltransferase [Clostridia bacterium]|nr:acyltransferase [Clostridia bacterium]
MKFIDSLWNKMLFTYYRVSVGHHLKCEGRLVIQGHGRYKIGDNCHFISKETISPVGGNRVVFQTFFPDSSIIIGNNVGISHTIICSKIRVEIEDNVLVGGGVKIYDTDFHSIHYEERLQSPDPGVKSKPVRICEGAFIGGHSIILKGVTVGKHSVIGAGSVVTHNVPDYEIWAGNPAVFVKRIHQEEKVNE